MSDHLPDFKCHKLYLKEKSPNFSVLLAELHLENINKCKSALLNIDRSDLSSTTDANTAYESFINKFTEDCNDKIPIIHKKSAVFLIANLGLHPQF